MTSPDRVVDFDRPGHPRGRLRSGAEAHRGGPHARLPGEPRPGARGAEATGRRRRADPDPPPRRLCAGRCRAPRCTTVSMVLEVLVGLMAKLAAKHIPRATTRRRMREAFRRLLAFSNDGGTAAFLDERRSFYDTILQIGGNHELQRMLPLMQIHLLRMQFQAYITPRDREKQFAEYQTITETILSGDGLRAEKVAGAARPTHAPEPDAAAGRGVPAIRTRNGVAHDDPGRRRHEGHRTRDRKGLRARRRRSVPRLPQRRGRGPSRGRSGRGGGRTARISSRPTRERRRLRCARRGGRASEAARSTSSSIARWTPMRRPALEADPAALHPRRDDERHEPALSRPGGVAADAARLDACST